MFLCRTTNIVRHSTHGDINCRFGPSRQVLEADRDHSPTALLNALGPATAGPNALTLPDSALWRVQMWRCCALQGSLPALPAHVRTCAAYLPVCAGALPQLDGSGVRELPRKAWAHTAALHCVPNPLKCCWSTIRNVDWLPIVPPRPGQPAGLRLGPPVELIYSSSSYLRSADSIRPNASRADCTSASVGGAVPYRATAYTRVSSSTDARSSGHKPTSVGP